MFCYYPLYLDWTTNQRSIPFGYVLHLLVQGHQGPVLFSGVSSVSIMDGEGSEDKVSVQIIQQNIKE